MYYYLVAVGSNKYHGQEPLTYSSRLHLAPGSIVNVGLRNEMCLGFVVCETDKPSFVVKEINTHHETIPSLPAHLLELFSWLHTYYPAPLGVTAQLFLPKNLPKQFKPLPEHVNPMSPTVNLPTLTDEQTAAVNAIRTSGTHIVHGETGSGKTRVYIELAKRTLEAGKSSIILTPEISLTPQLAKNFIDVFGEDKITLMHSSMTAATRRDAWLKVARTVRPQIVIGARSALFAPIQSLGLIVLDEAHESAYKQDSAPHYQAVRVAGKLAEICDAYTILGSATPSVSDYYVAGQRQRPIVRLSAPALGASDRSEVTTRIIDLRDRANMTRNPYISNILLDAIDTQLRNKQQTLLFLNRRGTARIVLCSQCGWQAICPHCDLPLTYHHDSHTLRCHTCDFSQGAITSCPTCHNSDITLKSIGTKTISSAMERLFPSARIQRFDADNLTGDRVHENYKEIHSGAIDIVIGTQLIAKGLDLPKLGLIGVINADASLHIPDFTAQERTYQLLYQVLGRVGRGHQSGQAIIQTYSPDDPTILAAVHKQWPQFYETELHERRTFMFPPFCYLLKASCQRSTLKSATTTAQRVRNELESQHLNIRIEGPAPAFHEKVHGKYTWQLIIKSKHRSELLRVITLLPKDWSYDIDPIDLL
jgi:primosomal protein N' (replication factor Y) (superfamily II helicase)